MATTIVRELHLPDELAELLGRRAAARGVTLEEQIVRDLATVEGNPDELTEDELLALIRRDRERMAAQGVHATEEFLAEAKAWGRK